MLDMHIHGWPEVSLSDAMKAAKGVQVATNRVDVEGNEDDALHSGQYNLQIDKLDIISEDSLHV